MDVLTYNQSVKAGAEQVGNKAHVLSRLAGWGFPVPKGIVLARGVYQQVMRDPQVAVLQKRAAAFSRNDLSHGAAVEGLNALREAIEQVEIAPKTREAIAETLCDEGLTDAALAVRSSATGEDGMTHSFAGIHESVLGCIGLDSVITAVLTCFASLWSDRAVAYRRHFDISDDDIECAVLLCQMVTVQDGDAPVAAGVIFTADPQTGRRDCMIIEAVPGLGDKLVSGEVTPKTIHAYAEGSRFVIDDDPFLPAAMLEELTAQADRAHWALNGEDQPQDIEWAWDGKEVTLLQARPITVLPRHTFAEIADQPAIWSNGNFKEVLSGILSPMGWSALTLGTASLFDLHHLAGYEVPKGMRMIRRFDGRAYVDAGVVQWAGYDAFGVMPHETNQTFGGFQSEITLPAHASKPGKRSFQQIRRFMPVMRAAKKARTQMAPMLDEMESRAKALVDVGFEGASDRELLEQSCALSDPEWQPPFILASSIGTIWLGLARQFGAGKLPQVDLERILGSAMAGQGGIVSAQHALELLEIVDQLEASSSEYVRSLESWVKKFGHRGYNEFDIACPRWGEAPQQVADLVQSLQMGTIDTRTRAQKMRNASRADLAKLPFYVRAPLNYFATRAAEGFRLREQAKSCLIAVIGISRHLMLEYGARLAERGHLKDPNDVFFLTYADFRTWALGLWDGTGAEQLVDERKAETVKWAAMPEPGDVILEEPEKLTVVHQTLQAEGNTYFGMGVSPGAARGRARKLYTPAQAMEMETGDILVARATDPSWTPLFLKASGIVVEIGGFLSHGAIVAREFGLPAVVNLPGIFDEVTDDSDVMIEGSEGTVKVIAQ